MPVNEKRPVRPVHLHGQWPPANSDEYPIKDSDDWWKVAALHRIDVWDLIEFNFKTRVPEEVNWYMRELLGCRFSSFDKRNYSFFKIDRLRGGKLYVPKAPVPALPRKKTVYQVMMDLSAELSRVREPRSIRIECIMWTIDQGGDDRVILWNHIAPDDRTPAPAHLVRRRDISTRASAVDPKWLYDNIKTQYDLDRQLPGNGLGLGNIVTSLRKCFEELNPDLHMFRGIHDQIVETHKTLGNWADVQEGGSSSMPREYRAIKDWVVRQTANPKSVLNCVIAAGT